MTRAVLTLLVAAVCLVGCTASEPSAPETPAQGISAIIGLYEAGDFESLVRTRYAEIGKAESEEQIVALIDRFEMRFGEMERYAETLQGFVLAKDVEAEISEDGTTAIYRLERGRLKLSRLPSGKWGFHM